MIDPVQNSIGYLFVIDLVFGFAANGGSIDKPALLDKIVHLLTHFDPVQIRYVGGTFRTLLDKVVTGNLFPVG